MWRRLRALTGPTGRRFLTVLLFGSLWLWWFCFPAGPRIRWELPEVLWGPVELAPDCRTLVTEPRLRPPDATCGLDFHPPRVPTVMRDVATGRDLLCPFPHDWYAKLLAFAPDASWVVARDGANRLYILDTRDGRQRGFFQPDACPDGSSRAWEIVTAPDIRGVALWHPSLDEIHLWDAATNRVRLVLQGAARPTRPPQEPLAIASDDGSRIAVFCGGRTDTLVVWDTRTGRELARQRLPGIPECRPAFSPGGGRLAWTLVNEHQLDRFRLYVWDGTAAPPIEFDEPCQKRGHTGIQFSSDGRWLVLGPAHDPLFWDMSVDPPAVWERGLSARSNNGYFVRRNPVFAPSGDRMIVPERVSMRFTSGPPPLHGDRDCLLSSVGTLIVAHSDEPGGMDLVDLAKPGRRISLSIPNDPSDYVAAGFSPDGRVVAVHAACQRPMAPANFDELLEFLRSGFTMTKEQFVVCLYDTSTGRRRAVIPTWDTGEPTVLSFAPDGQSVWTVEPFGGALRGRRWAIPSGWPPAWLLVATAAGILLLIADWRRGRRHKDGNPQST